MAALSACGQAEGPKQISSVPPADPVYITVPLEAAFGLALIAQDRQLWGDMAADLATTDDAGTARAFNGGLVAFGGLTLERFLFWRSGGAKMQFAGWANRPTDVGGSGVYAVREGLPDQARLLDHFIAGLKEADAWMRANTDEAAKLIRSKVGGTVDAGVLGLVAGAEANRMLLAPDADGESPGLKAMRKVDEAMRDAGAAGHRAFLPDIVAPSAAAVWMKR